MIAYLEDIFLNSGNKPDWDQPIKEDSQEELEDSKEEDEPE